MPVEPVDPQHAAVPLDAGQVVGEGGPQADAQLQDFRLGEAGVQGEGGGQQFEGAAHRDALKGAAFDLGGADHDFAAGAGRRVELVARMHQPHGPGELHLRRAHANRLAAHAAQALEAGPDAAAVDDDVGAQAVRIDRIAVADLAAPGFQRIEQGAVVQPALVRQVQAALKAAGQCGFERPDTVAVQPARLGRAFNAQGAVELVEQWSVRAVGYQQRAVDGVGHVQSVEQRRPEFEAALAHLENCRVRVRILACRRQHRRRRVCSAFRGFPGCALMQRHVGAAFGKAPADHSPHEARAGDFNPHWRSLRDAASCRSRCPGRGTRGPCDSSRPRRRSCARSRR